MTKILIVEFTFVPFLMLMPEIIQRRLNFLTSLVWSCSLFLIKGFFQTSLCQILITFQQELFISLKLSVEILYLCTIFLNCTKRSLPRAIKSLIEINKNLDEIGSRDTSPVGCLENNHLRLLQILRHTWQDNQTMHLSLFYHIFIII